MIDFKRFFKAIGIINDEDQTKLLEITVSNDSNPDTKVTLISKATQDRIIYLPDLDGTLATGTTILTPNKVVITNNLGEVTTGNITSSELISLENIEGNIEHRLGDITDSVDMLETKINDIIVDTLEGDESDKAPSVHAVNEALNDIVLDGYIKSDGSVAFDPNAELSFRNSSDTKDISVLSVIEGGGEDYIVFGLGGEKISLQGHNISMAANTTINLNAGGYININNKNIKNSADPIDPQDLATKAYVDSHSGGSLVTLTANREGLTDQVIGPGGFETVTLNAIIDTEEEWVAVDNSYHVEAGYYLIFGQVKWSAGSLDAFVTISGSLDFVTNNSPDKDKPYTRLSPIIYYFEEPTFIQLAVYSSSSSATIVGDKETYLCVYKLSSSGSLSGDVSDAENVGSGDGIFKDKTDSTLNFKTLVAGSGVTLTPSTNEIEISATGGSGGANNALSNLSAVQINTDLIFDPANAETRFIGFKTMDGFVPNILEIGTADGTAGSAIYTGEVVVKSGHQQFDNGVSGPITIQSGNATTQTGKVNIKSGLSSFGGDTGSVTGNIEIESGNTGYGSSGEVWLRSGQGLQASGNITIGTGISTIAPSGNISIATGEAQSGSGELLLTTGDINYPESSSEVKSGDIIIRPGTNNDNILRADTYIYGGRSSSGDSANTGGHIYLLPGGYDSGEAIVAHASVIVNSNIQLMSGTDVKIGRTEFGGGQMIVESSTALGKDTGNLLLGTGWSDSNSAGTSSDVKIYTGQALENGVPTGSVLITTGQSRHSHSGDVIISTGDNNFLDDGGTGDIILKPGENAASVNNQGKVVIDATSVVIPNHTTDDPSPVKGSMYYNTTDDTLRIYNGTSWKSITTI